MKCPECGMINDNNEMYCNGCGSPLGNTAYRPLGKKKSRWWIPALIIPVILLLLLAGGIFAFQLMVKRACISATDTIFTHARTLDFSDVDQSLLPDALKENPNLRALVEEELKNQIKATPFGQLIPTDTLDIGPLVDEITKDAVYEIKAAGVSCNQCTVTVRTANTDFSKIPESLANLIKEDAVNPDSDLWKAIQEQAGNTFGFNDSEEVDWGAVILSYYRNAKKNTPITEKEGKIVYGYYGFDFTNWMIKDYDRDLIRGFYGVDIPDEVFDRYLPSEQDETTAE